jgi:Tfp pilus assembly protein PilO
MKAKSPRDLIAQAVVVLAICVGAWLMLVKPKIDELARLEKQEAEHTAGSSQTLTQQTVENAARRMTALKDRVQTIKTYNALADDSSRFYGIVMDLADTHGVSVHSLAPGAGKQTEADGKITITRITLGVEGEYARVASFLDAVCTVNAFIRPLSLQIDPSRANDGSGVDASLTCDVLSFAVDGSLTELLASNGSIVNSEPAPQSAMGGTSHAQP